MSATVKTVGLAAYDSAKKTTDNGSSYSTLSGTWTLNSLDTVANGDWIIVGGNYPFYGLVVTVGNTNGNASTLAAHYWNGSAWTAVDSLSDGTAAGGATLAQNGTITFTMPTTWVASTIDGTLVYWLRLSVSAALDATVTTTAVTVNGVVSLAAANLGRRKLLIKSQAANTLKVYLSEHGSGTLVPTSSTGYEFSAGNEFDLLPIYDNITGPIFAVPANSAAASTLISVWEF